MSEGKNFGEKADESKEPPIKAEALMKSLRNLFDLYETLDDRERGLIDSARQIAFEFLQKGDTEGLKTAIATKAGEGRFPLYDIKDREVLKKVSKLFAKEIKEQLESKKVRAPETREETEQIEEVMARYAQTANKAASFCEEYLQELRGQEEYSPNAKKAIPFFQGELNVSNRWKRSIVSSRAWIRHSTIDFADRIKQIEDEIVHMEGLLRAYEESAEHCKEKVKEDLGSLRDEEQ